MKTIEKCRSCASEKLTDILDLGEQYTSDFREDDSKPPAYPLQAVLCEDCMLVQLRHTTPSHEMYHENYGFKSGINDSIKADLAEIVERGMEYKPSTWLDIASNDGTLLSFVPSTVYKTGIDPISRLCKEARQHADRIVTDFFDPKYFKDETFDVITSISCFYDMDDPNEFVEGVKSVLAEDGVWIIQQNYLLTTLQLLAVDNFCHEHLEYYTLLSLTKLLQRHGLQIFRVETNMVNGGSLRTYVQRTNKRPVEKSVIDRMLDEEQHGLQFPNVYKAFGDNARARLYELHDLVEKMHRNGKRIVILAASTRGSTIWQAAGIQEFVEYAVERNPEKVGRWFSAIGIPIKSEEYFRDDKPDAAIVGPWFFKSEFLKREHEYLNNDGSLIFPLPKVEIVHR